MFKKTVLAVLASATLATAAGAISLDPFNADFQTLMNGVARDVAPTLRLGALSGDLQGDATIDHFDLTLFGLGITVSDGLGKVLVPGATTWTFVLPMDSFVPSVFSDTAARIMAYPSFKFAFGMALPAGWDATLSGNFLPGGVVSGLASSFLSGKAGPDLGYSNVGLQVRKSLLADGAGPALSLGGGYHFSSFHLSASADDYLPVVTLPGNLTQTTTGSIGFDSVSQVFTADLHVSKHLLFFTPFAKLSGAFQLSQFTGKADLKASVYDPSGPSTTVQKIGADSVVDLADFTFLTTAGFDLNLFLVHFNLNVVADLGRAALNIHDFSLKGIDANAFSLNTGFHFSF
jgi:hypothetical protein